MGYESLNERMFYSFLEVDREVIRYYVQPIRVSIKTDDEEWCHVPDVLVFRHGCCPLLYQIKENEQDNLESKTILWNTECEAIAVAYGWNCNVALTVCQIIDLIDNKVKLTHQNPSKPKQIYDEVARGYADREALGRLDIIQMDHTKLDISVIDDIIGQIINRPWLTLGICVYSREPWCMGLFAEGPSENTVRKAIQHEVFPKNTVHEYGTQREWAASGIPNAIYVDNGVDFKGNDIKWLVNETLKSDLRHRPVKLPHYGAIIECLFGTINRELIHNIWGTTKAILLIKGIWIRKS